MMRASSRFALVLAAAAMATQAYGQDDLIWDQPVSGLFSDANAWFSSLGGSTGLFSPGPADNIVFDKDGTYTVSLDANSSVHRLFHEFGASTPVDVTIDMNGFNLDLLGGDGVSINDFSFTQGFLTSGVGSTITFVDGTANVLSNIYAAGLMADPFGITVGAGGAVLNENFIAGSEGFAWSRIGAYDGNGQVVNVQDGGLYRAAALSVGINGRPVTPGVENVGTINVDGAGSRLESGGQNVFGAGTGFWAEFGSVTGVTTDGSYESDSTGNLNVTNGGVAHGFVYSFGFLQDASDAPPAQAIGNGLSDGAGSDIISDFSFIVGEAAGGVGTITASNGGQITAAQPGFLGFRVGLGGEGTVHVLSGGQMVDNEQSTIGEAVGGVGVVNVSGAGSAYTTNSAFVGDAGTGDLNISSGGSATVNDFLQLGTAAGSDGAVSVSGAGSTLNVAATLVVGVDGAGSVSLSSGGSATVGAAGPPSPANTLTINSGGLVFGGGTITGNVANMSGEIQGFNTLTINGNYSQGAAGVYTEALASVGLNTALDISGSAALAGELLISADPGYVPAALDSFLIMSYASVTGGFTSVTNRDLPGAGPGGEDLVFAHVQLTDEYRLVVTVPGDFNLDGLVNGADFTVWADGFGSGTTAFNHGDGNADGVTNGADFTIWADNFGSDITGAPFASTAVPTKDQAEAFHASLLERIADHDRALVNDGLGRGGLAVENLGGTAVPEPSTILLGAMAALGVLALRRRA